ncbi:MAG: DUF2141 domain-containing protein [Bacteroides sp.]|jgi:uncharacterized protein (DUF2141 family)|nr:DUF2141 domain-containing protein [Bacteroides sp.]
MKNQSRKSTGFLGSIGLLLLISQAISAQSLTLEVQGIEKVKGNLRVGIFNSKETFMKKPLAGFGVPVKDKVMIIPCKGLPAGSYAISMFQDENSDGVLNTESYGRPIEKYGFSNDATGVMGPPSYEKCCFTFAKDTTLVVHLK